MNDQPELRHLRYFVAVAEELHFGRAAQRLHIAQPPLSQQIRKLEELVGFPLLLRTSRAVRLTPAGEVLLDRARQILGKLESDLESVRAAGRGETGPLNLGFVGSAMLTRLPSILGKYRALYPGVDLRLHEFYTANLLSAILDGTIDVGLVRDGGTHEDLHVEPVLTEPFICVLPRTHPLAGLKAIPARRLRYEPFVLYSPRVGEQAWKRMAQICEREGFQPRVVQEAPQWPTIIRLVGAGLGVTLAPLCVSKLVDAEVVWRRLSPGRAFTSIDLVYRKEISRPSIGAFCRLVRAGYGVRKDSASRIRTY